MADKKNILIAYFSRADKNYCGGSIVDLKVGNTEVIAESIAHLLGADLFKIEPVKKYSADYTACTEEAKRDLRANLRPELVNNLPGIDQYDVILLGYPNYWGTMPMPVWTFLESHDFSNKTILPLCTHEGSGLGSSESDIRKLCPKATVLPGLAVRGSAVKTASAEVENWLKRNGLL
jgi:flavodoxin